MNRSVEPTRTPHLGEHGAALVDGELSHRERERALGHVAGCVDCRTLLDAERAVKARLGALPAPEPAARLLAALGGMATGGFPLPPTSPVPATAPLVPPLAAPGRAPRGARGDARGPRSLGGSRRGLRRGSVQRARYAAVGALSIASVVLGTAFAAGGAGSGAGTVVPPAAELSVEHDATSTSVLLGDPGFASLFGTTPSTGSTDSATPPSATSTATPTSTATTAP